MDNPTVPAVPAFSARENGAKIDDAAYYGAARFSVHALAEFSANPWAFFACGGLAGAAKRAVESLNGSASPALDLGRAVHAAVLEPDDFDARFTALPPEITVKRGKAWDAFRAENAGKTVLTAAQMATVDGIRAALASPAFECVRNALDFLPIGTETPLFFDLHGHACKAKPDRLNALGVVDLKTCDDASPDAFARAASKYGYHRQAAFYLDAVRACGCGVPEQFVFICIEKTEPFTPAIYTFEKNSDFIAAGRLANDRAFALYDALAPKYESGEMRTGYAAHNLDLPAWDDDFRALQDLAR